MSVAAIATGSLTLAYGLAGLRTVRTSPMSGRSPRRAVNLYVSEFGRLTWPFERPARRATWWRDFGRATYPLG